MKKCRSRVVGGTIAGQNHPKGRLVPQITLREGREGGWYHGWYSCNSNCVETRLSTQVPMQALQPKPKQTAGTAQLKRMRKARNARWHIVHRASGWHGGRN